MLSTLLGQKKGMRQIWTKSGARWPVTQVVMGGNVVVRDVSSKGQNDQSDQATSSTKVQIAFGDKKMKNVPQPTAKQLAQAGIQVGKRQFCEANSISNTSNQDDDQVKLQPGQTIQVEDVFKAGDVVKVTGTTKGRGFAGVVKRWGFAGGKRTHGQSDRQRAPGSIGAGTTPGRVWVGKKMPGHYGVDKQTLENLVIVAVDAVTQSIWVKGTIPGSYNGLVQIRKTDRTSQIELNDFSAQQLVPVSATIQEETEQPVIAEQDNDQDKQEKSE